MRGGRLDAYAVRRGLDDLGVDGLLGALGLLEGAKRQPRGRVVLCPHHREKNPSCSVQTRDGRVVAHCFTCGWRGDSLAIVAEVRGLDVHSGFADVLAEGADLAGIYPTTDDAPRRREPPKPRPNPEPEPPALADEVFDALVAALVAVAPVTAEPDIQAYLAGRGLLDEAEAAGWGALPVSDQQWRVLKYPIELAGRAMLGEKQRGEEPWTHAEVWAAGLEAFRLSGLAQVDKRCALVLDERGFPRCSHAAHRLVIPHRSPEGLIYAAKRRDLLPKALRDQMKRAGKKPPAPYIATTGRPIRWPYGVEAMKDAAPDVPVMFVEGEADTLDRRVALREAGVVRVVLGVPGVSTWRPEWAAYARGRVAYVGLDTDEAGQRKVADVVRDLYAAGAGQVKRATPNGGKDWNQRSEVRP